MIKSYLYNKLLKKLRQHKDSLSVVSKHPSLNQWRHSISDNPSTAISFLVDKFTSDLDSALVLFLQEVYRETHDDEFSFLCKDIFDDIKSHKINSYKGELEQLYDHKKRGWAEDAYVERRSAQLNDEISRWQQKQYTMEEKSDMFVTKDVLTLEEMVEKYGNLKLQKDVYTEFNHPVPEPVLKQMRKLRRQIEAQIEMQKDNKRDEIKALLQETETVEEKRARLKKELAELGEG